MSRLDHVPIGKIAAPDSINARLLTEDGIETLAHNIASVGLIQPITVRPNGKEGHYEVIDGRRRWAAIQKLLEDGTWAKTEKVPVFVRDAVDDVSALEMSLSANVVRLGMHPVEQFEVISKLVEAGRSEKDIAGRFNISVGVVRQRLALGNLHADIRDAWRSGKIDEEVAKVFTMEPNQKRQKAVYDKLTKSHMLHGAYAVRQALAENKLQVNRVDPQIIEAYKAAGGTLTESLFDEHRFIDDPELLNKMIAAHHQGVVEQLKKDGWKWAWLSSELPSGWQYKWPRVHVERKYTPEEKKRLKEIDEIDDTDVDEDALWAEREAIEDAAEARAFSKKARSELGVVVEADSDGSYSLVFGIKPPETIPGKPEPGADPVDPEAGGEPEEDPEPKISSALLTTLTETRTLAAQRALAEDRHLALAALVAGLTAESYVNPVKVTGQGYSPEHRPRDGKFADVLGIYRAMDLDKLLGIVAAEIGRLLDMRSYNPGSEQSGDYALIRQLDAKLYTKLAQGLFLAEDYFKRATKWHALQALDEIAAAGGPKVPSDAPTWKKGELAETAAKLAVKHGWLPPELRHRREGDA